MPDRAISADLVRVTNRRRSLSVINSPVDSVARRRPPGDLRCCGPLGGLMALCAGTLLSPAHGSVRGSAPGTAAAKRSLSQVRAECAADELSVDRRKGRPQ